MSAGTVSQTSNGRFRRLLGGCFKSPSFQSAVVAVAVLAVLCVTLGDPGLTWDEPPGITRQHAMHNWIGKLLGRRETRAEAFSFDGHEVPCDCRACETAVRSDAKPFDRAGVELGWPFARRAPDEHPPVYALLSYLTWRGTQRLWGPLRAHRLATALMFAATAGVLFHVVRRRLSLLAACTAVGALVSQPRLFSHAHLATTDVIMASFWFLAAAAFLYTAETGRKAWGFGVLAGLALMSKITGGLVALPLIVWTVLHRRHQARRALLIAVPIIPLVMVLVHPGWWPVPSDPLRPLTGVARWYDALVHHDQRVPVFFLGRVYDYRKAFLPWHNAFFLTATAVPLSLLAAALLGIVGSVIHLGAARRNGQVEVSDLRSQTFDSPFKKAARRLHKPSTPEEKKTRHAAQCAFSLVSTWALLNFLTLILLRTFTAMPGHDGLRQMIPAFPFFAVLAGCGVYMVESRCQARFKLAVVAVVSALAVLPAAYQTARTHPYQMSYYNSLIGGTVGAQRVGMETTYYWDSATRDVIDWLNENLPPRAKLVIAPPPDVRTFEWLQRWGRLRGDVNLLQHDQWLRAGRSVNVFVVLQSREGLIRTYRGLSTYADRAGTYEVVPDGINVRLLAVFKGPQTSPR